MRRDAFFVKSHAGLTACFIGSHALYISQMLILGNMVRSPCRDTRSKDQQDMCRCAYVWFVRHIMTIESDAKVFGGSCTSSCMKAAEINCG